MNGKKEAEVVVVGRETEREEEVLQFCTAQGRGRGSEVDALSKVPKDVRSAEERWELPQSLFGRHTGPSHVVHDTARAGTVCKLS